MTPQRFRQIEALYHAARQATGAERDALLAQADPKLRREVESLLAQADTGKFLARPALENALEIDDATVTHLTAGACLGPYRIDCKLGEGGMGAVFRAVDTRLGRAVAIKTAHRRFTDRFQREARAISSLNHPHICTLYDLGPDYLVMELVEGETVAECLKRGPLPVETARRYGIQMAAALSEAHSKGIVHRDLKPGNLMIARSGVKVLDFGLAKSDEDETVTASRMVVGTPAYMAPEQRLGKTVDARSDIYSFGCTLYEMLTGARVTAEHKRVPSRKLEQIVNRCMEEDPARRWQSAAELERSLEAAGGRTLPSQVFAVAAAAVVLGLSGVAYFLVHRAPKLTDKDTLVLADFDNKTGDAVFDGTLRQGLAAQLEQSSFLSIVSDERIQQTLRFMGRPPEAGLTAKIAREVCERTGSTAVLDGSISGLGSRYILGLTAQNCRTGDVLVQEQRQAANKDDVLNSLSQLANDFRKRAGESSAAIHSHSKPLAEATTSSLEALKAYSMGYATIGTKGAAAAIPHFERAVAIDPNFAMAHAMVGFMRYNSGATDLGALETRRAYELRDRVSEQERLYILMLYDRQVTGNLQKEIQTLETWAQNYPRDATPVGIMAGWATRGTGQYEKGIQSALAAVQLDPDAPYAYSSIADHYMFLGRFAEAASAIRRATERQPNRPEFINERYFLAWFQHDPTGMQREIDLARGQPLIEDRMAHDQAMVLAYSGRAQEARAMWQRATALAEQNGSRERAALFQGAAAVCEAQFGNAPAAKAHAAEALRLGQGRDVEYAVAFALALSGDSSGALRHTADLAKRFPEDTPVQFEYLPTLRALAALAHGQAFDAIEQLKSALPFDAALPGTAFYARFGGLYPAYVRGEAYLAARRGQEAAAEFQKVLDHRGVVFADPIGVLARWKMGKAWAMAGDAVKAKAAYQDFFTVWKYADREVPVLKQAEADYATLK